MERTNNIIRHERLSLKVAVALLSPLLELIMHSYDQFHDFKITAKVLCNISTIKKQKPNFAERKKNQFFNDDYDDDSYEVLNPNEKFVGEIYLPIIDNFFVPL